MLLVFQLLVDSKVDFLPAHTDPTNVGTEHLGLSCCLGLAEIFNAVYPSNGSFWLYRRWVTFRLFGCLRVKIATTVDTTGITVKMKTSKGIVIFDGLSNVFCFI